MSTKKKIIYPVFTVTERSMDEAGCRVVYEPDSRWPIEVEVQTGDGWQTRVIVSPDEAIRLADKLLEMVAYVRDQA